MFKKALLVFEIIPKLGYWNFFYAVWYKLSLKLGVRKLMFPKGQSVSGLIFKGTADLTTLPVDEWSHNIIAKADEIGRGVFTYFSFHKKTIPSTNNLAYIPNWFFNPFENVTYSQQKKHWTELSDFGEGDIKIIWEISRFDWVTDLARAYKISGNEKHLLRLNSWLEDWSSHNPLNLGPNWKCGQETSFRVMKLLTAAHCLSQYNTPSAALKEWIKQHVLRIYPNINYAISQDNNHGTSEAIGLYIGAAWLIHNGESDPKFHKFKRKGRQILEERILKLIQNDGTFAQKSMTYHRVVLDTMSFVLHNMMLLKESDFSPEMVERLTNLGEWQYKMTFGTQGDAPNFGSNDGAMIENLHSRPYRDFRPSTQLFYGALKRKRVYEDISLSESAYWRFGSEALLWPIEVVEIPKAEILDKQILIMRNERANVFMKLPEDTFRPVNDAFHVDLWINGEPVLVDAGSYSYNAGELTDRYKSVSFHNTIQFGNEEQMPKIGRFLNGKWISLLSSNPIEYNNDKVMWSGTYKDFRHNTHFRKLTLSPTNLLIEDTVISSFDVHSRYHFNKDKYSIQIHPVVKSMASSYYLEQHETVLYEDVRKNSDHKRREINLTFEISFV